jgi:hypothetical protein
MLFAISTITWCTVNTCSTYIIRIYTKIKFIRDFGKLRKEISEEIRGKKIQRLLGLIERHPLFFTGVPLQSHHWRD